ncbi:MAG: putative porin [Rhodocyclaceae bacterium]|nr:putative porin [Rhodocyclaceae bacterium]
MNRKHNFAAAAAALALVTAFAAAPAAANERESLEALQETTMGLIDALVEQGILPQEKADAMVKAAQAKAAKAAARQKTAAAGAPVRVQYVPESVKAEIREQIKQEVMAQARNERWAEPNAVPAWVDRIKWEGDLRVRYQSESMGKSNTAPIDYITSAASGTTRAVGFLGNSTVAGPTGNTTDDRERYRLRARLGLLARVTDGWTAGFRLTTGNVTDRVSTNQSLGQDFNKYQIVLDRAYVKYEPVEWFSASAGRMPNPFYGTDLVWDEDLNFEGFAATFKPVFAEGRVRPFLTVGAFPMKEDAPPNAEDRWLHGVQGGAKLALGQSTQFTLGAAWFDYDNLEGRLERDPALGPVAGFGQYEYGNGLRQKGNTLFLTDFNRTDGVTPNLWGLASKFRPFNLTASLDLAHFDPVHVILTADYVKNTAFDRGEIQRRTSLAMTDGKDYGYMYRIMVGMPKLEQRHDWNFSYTYRYLGSDATIDGFTDSDFGLGGTNLRGHILAFNYGIDPNAWLAFRYISARQIDSFSLNPNHRYSADTMMADVNVRF